MYLKPSLLAQDQEVEIYRKSIRNDIFGEKSSHQMSVKSIHSKLSWILELNTRGFKIF
jgi:hypothetical protein